MSQVFGADSVTISTSATITLNNETTAVTGNFVNPPFQNAKAIILAQFMISTGTGTNIVTVRIRRNPNAENVVVASGQTMSVSSVAGALISLQGSDAPIGPGPVQYALTVQPGAATGNGTLNSANITTLLISG